MALEVAPTTVKSSSTADDGTVLLGSGSGGFAEAVPLSARPARTAAGAASGPGSTAAGLATVQLGTKGGSLATVTIGRGSDRRAADETDNTDDDDDDDDDDEILKRLEDDEDDELDDGDGADRDPAAAGHAGYGEGALVGGVPADDMSMDSELSAALTVSSFGLSEGELGGEIGDYSAGELVIPPWMPVRRVMPGGGGRGGVRGSGAGGATFNARPRRKSKSSSNRYGRQQQQQQLLDADRGAGNTQYTNALTNVAADVHTSGGGGGSDPGSNDSQDPAEESTSIEEGEIVVERGR